MNSFTIVGILFTSVSSVGLLVVSARWGIKDVLDEYTGKGRATAIARMESQRDAITGSQTSGFIQKYSAVDKFASQELRNFSRSTADLTLSSLGSSASVSKKAPIAKSSSLSVSNQPNQLNVEVPKVKSTEELLRADVPEMNYDVSTEMSEKTSMLSESEETSVLFEDSGDVSSSDETSILGEFNETDGQEFFNSVFVGSDVHETSILDVEETASSEVTDAFSESGSLNASGLVTGNRFVVTGIYNNIEL